MAAVAVSEAGESAAAVLGDALVEFAGHSDVEGAGNAAQDVDVAGWHGEIVVVFR